MTAVWKVFRDVLVLIGIATIILGVVATAYLKWEQAGAALLGAGIALLANGLSEVRKYLSTTTELTCDERCLDLEDFDKSIRVSLLVKNKGNVTIRDAKAALTLEKGETLKGLVKDNQGNKCDVCPVRDYCPRPNYLVNIHNPHVDGEALSWALPEKPIHIGNYVYTHMTSISPGQRSRLLLFDVRPCGINSSNQKFVVSFYSEYGAPGPSDPPGSAPKRPYRVCIQLGDDVKEICAKITIYGKGMRRPYEQELCIRYDALKEICKKSDRTHVEQLLHSSQKIRRR